MQTIRLFEAEKPDIILDLMLPEMMVWKLLKRFARQVVFQLSCFQQKIVSLTRLWSWTWCGWLCYQAIFKPWTTSVWKALLRRTELVAVDNQEEDTKYQSLPNWDLEILPDAYVAKNMEVDLAQRVWVVASLSFSSWSGYYPWTSPWDCWGVISAGDVRTVVLPLDVYVRRLKTHQVDLNILTRRGVRLLWK